MGNTPRYCTISNTNFVRVHYILGSSTDVLVLSGLVISPFNTHAIFYEEFCNDGVFFFDFQVNPVKQFFGFLKRVRGILRCPWITISCLNSYARFGMSLIANTFRRKTCTTRQQGVTAHWHPMCRFTEP